MVKLRKCIILRKKHVILKLMAAAHLKKIGTETTKESKW